ncbi:hypothetical protein E2C01_077866 [Portunus trituberculatus]|uniref:Uncharacterized protein n=1 Tax=Portunus trituberculatus TaxID=210409 RepID=A0A5B7IMG1_PORTR|nr:hypothetical protein [Portunus trituberculatus]
MISSTPTPSTPTPLASTHLSCLIEAAAPWSLGHSLPRKLITTPGARLITRGGLVRNTIH